MLMAGTSLPLLFTVAGCSDPSGDFVDEINKKYGQDTVNWRNMTNHELASSYNSYLHRHGVLSGVVQRRPDGRQIRRRLMELNHETLDDYGVVSRPINSKYYDIVYKLLMHYIDRRAVADVLTGIAALPGEENTEYHLLRGDGKEAVVELAIDQNGLVLDSKVIRCGNENDRRVWSDALFGFDTVPKPPQPILYRWKLCFPLTNE